jgi:cytochrome c-type biogenesis protein CcmH/NrfF
MDLTASFLAGSLLSWAMPIALLAAVLVYWGVILRRRSRGDA